MPQMVLSIDGVILRGYELRSARTTIGRRSDSDIQLDDPTVSARHAVLLREPSPYLDGHYEFILEDCGSTNGTVVNTRPVKRLRMTHGDVIRIGRSELRFDDGRGVDTERTAVFLPEGRG